MRAELIRIAKSRGLRIDKPLIEQVGLGDTVKLRVERERLVISPERRPRQGWEDAFRAAGEAANDELLFHISGANDFDREWRF